jgi:ceramide glucosyltransferase
MHNWISLFGEMLIAASVAGCVYLIHASVAVGRFVRDRTTARDGRGPVSVLKPLRGEDPGLYDNLASFFRQDIEEFQIVFGVSDAADPALPIVRRLCKEFPKVDVALVIDDHTSGSNPKIANLRNMLPAAKHELLVISDSDMRVSSTYLGEVSWALRQPGVALVTCLYRGISGGGFWSQLACLYINHTFLPQAVVGAGLNVGSGCFGATLALRRRTLEAIGGFAVAANTLADDHVLGNAVRTGGGRVVISRHFIDNIVVEPGLGCLFRHELRWARTVRSVAPLGFAGSVITHPMMLALLALIVGGQPILAAGTLFASLALRVATAIANNRALGLRHVTIWLLPIRDALTFALFLCSFFAQAVTWRDQTFRVRSDGTLVSN